MSKKNIQSLVDKALGMSDTEKKREILMQIVDVVGKDENFVFEAMQERETEIENMHKAITNTMQSVKGVDFDNGEDGNNYLDVDYGSFADLWKVAHWIEKNIGDIASNFGYHVTINHRFVETTEYKNETNEATHDDALNEELIAATEVILKDAFKGVLGVQEALTELATRFPQDEENGEEEVPKVDYIDVEHELDQRLNTEDLIAFVEINIDDEEVGNSFTVCVNRLSLLPKVHRLLAETTEELVVRTKQDITLQYFVTDTDD
jgi:hypothetical protein